MSQRKRYIPDLKRDAAECDANYIRILQLFPAMAEEDQREIGVWGTVADGTVVEVTVTERCPYTSMIRVRVSNDDDKPWIKWPTLEVRVYHDVKSAEVISFERHRRFDYRYEYPNSELFLPDEKSQINRYFGELLRVCLAHGHAVQSIDLF